MKNSIIDRIDYPIPQVIDSLSSNYVSEDVLQHGYFFLHKKKDVYVKASLVMKQFEIKEKFEWKIWVKIDLDDFSKMTSNLKKDINMIPGILVSPILFYEDTADLVVNVLFEMEDYIVPPKISILKNNSNLYNDYSNGVPLEKYLEWQKKLSR